MTRPSLQQPGGYDRFNQSLCNTDLCRPSLGLAQGELGEADQGIAKIDEALALANKSKKSWT
jgi:hypothetical protein